MPDDDFMKSIGYPGGKDATKAPSAGPDTAQAAEGAPAGGLVVPESLRQKTYDEMDWQGKMGQGVAKGLAGMATGIPKLANRAIGLVSPGLSETLGDYAERVPGVKRLENFAESESEGGWETAGNLGITGATMLMGPGELKLGAKLASKFPYPSFAGGGAGFVPKARPWVKGVGDVAETVIRGAAGGAMTDPNDPLTGAAAGAVGGGLPLGAAKFAGTRAGQYMAGMAARHLPTAATVALGHAIGIPASVLWGIGIPELFAFYHSPIGRQLHRGGARVAELIGRAVEQGNPNLPRGAGQKIAAFLTDPRLAGGASGRAADAAFNTDTVQAYVNPPEPEPAEAAEQ